MGVYIAASTVVNGAVPRNRDTRIVAGSELMDSACTNDDGYVFRWSAARSDGTEVVLDPSTTYSNTPQLFLPKRSLPPGVSYTLRFEGRQASNSRVSAATEFDFYVQAAALEAIVTGGDALLAENVPLTLDASASVDPDQETEYEWDFSWLCEATAPAAGDCLTTDGAKLALPRVSQAVVSDIALRGAEGPDGQTYAFTLTARKGARRASVTTMISVVSAAPDAKGVPPKVYAPPFPGGGAVNPGVVARVSATVVSEADASSLRLLWSGDAHARRRRDRRGGEPKRRGLRRVHVAHHEVPRARAGCAGRRVRVPLSAGRVGRQRRGGGVPDAPEEHSTVRRRGGGLARVRHGALYRVHRHRLWVGRR
jgi:hypothetical protein